MITVAHMAVAHTIFPSRLGPCMTTVAHMAVALLHTPYSFKARPLYDHSCTHGCCTHHISFKALGPCMITVAHMAVALLHMPYFLQRLGLVHNHSLMHTWLLHRCTHNISYKGILWSQFHTWLLQCCTPCFPCMHDGVICTLTAFLWLGQIKKVVMSVRVSYYDLCILLEQWS